MPRININELDDYILDEGHGGCNDCAGENQIQWSEERQKYVCKFCGYETDFKPKHLKDGRTKIKKMRKNEE